MNDQNVYPWLDRREYPFKSHFFQTPVGRMHYVDEGAGEPIVMVHGNPAWSFAYRNVIKSLYATNRCIAPDHIGFGLSDKPADWDYLPVHHAQNLEALLDSLNLTDITLVVNDWGGPTGLSYAIRHPERIKRLIILNTWMWSVANDKYYRNFSGFMGGPVGSFLIRYFNIFGKMVVKKATGDPSKMPAAIHAHYYKHLDSPAHRKGSYVFPREIIGSSDWLDSLWKQRSRINSIPTTFIWGMKDIAFREQELDFWVSHWDHPEVIRIPTAGHFPQEENPGIIIEALKRKI
jgi:haloalkane dehalogenase